MSRAKRKPRFTVDVRALELVRGHDGLLRGHPDPVLLLAHYRVAGTTLSPCGRLLTRFRPRGAYPVVVPPPAPATLACNLRTLPPHVLFLIALEEDGGGDVQRLFGLLDGVPALDAWEIDRDVPAPEPLAAALARRDDGPRRVRLLGADGDLGERCRSDKWVGASIVPLDERAHVEDVRVWFRAEDRRNEWTAVLRVDVR